MFEYQTHFPGASVVNAQQIQIRTWNVNSEPVFNADSKLYFL